MASPDKVTAVAELTERFTSSAGAVLTEYRGLTVAALRELRRSLGENATYAVSKNTLTTIAARNAGVEGVEDLLVGPTAIAFIDGDPVVVAKGLRDFARNNPLLIIKGGVLEGRFVSPDEVRRLADLESREVLLARVAGGMKAALQNAVSLFAAPLSQMARLAAALQDAAAQNPSLIGGAGTAAAAAADTSTDVVPAAVDASTDVVPAAVDTSTDAAPAVEPATEAAPVADAVTDAVPAGEAVTEAVPAADAGAAAVTDAAHAADVTPPADAADNNS